MLCRRMEDNQNIPSSSQLRTEYSSLVYSCVANDFSGIIAGLALPLFAIVVSGPNQELAKLLPAI